MSGREAALAQATAEKKAVELAHAMEDLMAAMEALRGEAIESEAQQSDLHLRQRELTEALREAEAARMQIEAQHNSVLDRQRRQSEADDRLRETNNTQRELFLRRLTDGILVRKFGRW